VPIVALRSDAADPIASVAKQPIPSEAVDAGDLPCRPRDQRVRAGRFPLP
jgi:hypothetical protein